MSPFRIGIVLCLAAAQAVAQAPEPEPETPPAEPVKPSVRDAIDAGNYFFVKAFDARDARAIAELYTEDARVIAPGAEPAAGRQAIAAFWAGAMEATKGVRLETLAVESDGTLAFEEGVVHLTATDGTESTERYLVVWKRIGRRWHLHRDIWNAGPAVATPPSTPEPQPSTDAPGTAP